jgi:hypothetical protein
VAAVAAVVVAVVVQWCCVPMPMRMTRWNRRTWSCWRRCR